MNSSTFTLLSEAQIRALLRAELEAFFHDNPIPPTPKVNPNHLGGIDLAQEVTGLKKPTIYALVHRREIPHLKKGKKLYFKREEIEAWIEEGRKSTVREIATQAEIFIDGKFSKK